MWDFISMKFSRWNAKSHHGVIEPNIIVCVHFIFIASN